MGDLFDEFMEELRRRQADARRGHPSRPSERGRERSGADDEPPESDADSDPMLSANDGTREPGADATSVSGGGVFDEYSRAWPRSLLMTAPPRPERRWGPRAGPS